MAGTTPNYGLRYPGMYDVVNADSWLDLSNDLETAFAALDVKRQKALNRPSARAVAGTNLIAASTTTTVVFGSETFDNANLFSFGAPDRMTLSAGLWLVLAETTMLFGYTTATSLRTIITINGAAHTSQKTAAVIQPVAHLTAFVEASAGDLLRMQARWTGTGGPGDITGAMTATRIREP